MTETIGNPLSWAFGAVRSVFSYGSSVASSVGAEGHAQQELPVVRTLTKDDLKTALRKGWDDLAFFRSDVVFVCLLYPIMGIVLVALAVQGDFVHLMFPAVSGFALAGPVAAVGLYEMSRRREKGLEANWTAYIDVLRSQKFGAVVVLGLFHMVVFSIWIMVANMIFDVTLGSENPRTIMAFFQDALTTPAGWAMIVIGVAVGFVFAAVVLAMSVVSFPLLLDRDVSLPVAVVTSVNVALMNPVPIAIWGAIVAGLLALGSIPALLGLVLVMPLLGHATWHLYRAAVV